MHIIEYASTHPLQGLDYLHALHLHTFHMRIKSLESKSLLCKSYDQSKFELLKTPRIYPTHNLNDRAHFKSLFDLLPVIRFTQIWFYSKEE